MCVARDHNNKIVRRTMPTICSRMGDFGRRAPLQAPTATRQQSGRYRNRCLWRVLLLFHPPHKQRRCLSAWLQAWYRAIAKTRNTVPRLQRGRFARTTGGPAWGCAVEPIDVNNTTTDCQDAERHRQRKPRVNHRRQKHSGALVASPQTKTLDTQDSRERHPISKLTNQPKIWHTEAKDTAGTAVKYPKLLTNQPKMVHGSKNRSTKRGTRAHKQNASSH